MERLTFIPANEKLVQEFGGRETRVGADPHVSSSPKRERSSPPDPPDPPDPVAAGATDA